jgi:4-hydroxy-4-methyl-2-oxoglutarate aldolase
MTSSLHTPPLEEICERYKRLYTPAVADILDSKGLWHQIMNNDLKGLTMDMVVAGPAFTVLGMCERSEDKAIRKGPLVVDRLGQYQVAVFETGGDTHTGHWGELLSNAARTRGAHGAVIDGGVRDTRYILQIDFPVFCRFRCPGDATGRWNVVDMEIPVTVGGVRVHPGDFVFGDADGVVVVPKELTIPVLLEAESVLELEDEIRQKVRAGESVEHLYRSYERF